MIIFRRSGFWGSSVSAELVHRLLCVNLARLEDDAGEVGTVGAVGEVLCLETECTVLAEGGSVGALESVQPVAAVELHAGLSGVHLHHTSAHRLGALHCEAQFARFALVEHVAVVVAGAVDYLLVGGVMNAFTHGVGCTEVKWSALHLEDFSSGDACLVDRDKEVGILRSSRPNAIFL